MALYNKKLQELKEQREFVDIYTDIYDESIFGFIVDYNETFLVLDSYSDSSLADGIVVFFRENISRIRWGGNEISASHAIAKESTFRNELPIIDLTNINSVIETMNNHFGYVNVLIEDITSDVCFIGEVTEMDEKSILIHEFGPKMSLDRKHILLDLEDITRVEGGGHYERSLLPLFKEKTSS